MNLAELATRLAATTMFSPLQRPLLLSLLERSPRRRALAGDALDEGAGGLSHHLVLLSGEVEVQRGWIAADGSECCHIRRIGVAADGPGFGLVSAAGRQLRVRAVSDVDCLAIDGEELDDLLGWGFLGAFLMPEPHLKVFHRLPVESVSRALRCLVERRVDAGETVITQGEPGEHYYIILEGEAEVWETEAASGEPRLVNRLVDGDSFGEAALLSEGPRTATVTMATPGRLLVLSKADFDVLLKPPMVEEIAAADAKALVDRGEARWLDCRHPGEHAERRIPGAELVPLDSLRHDGVFGIEAGVPYIVYCRNGRRSRAAVFLLRERGIAARALAGGIADWPYALEDAAA
jgi:rhodanese-related sulfurtransferase